MESPNPATVPDLVRVEDAAVAGVAVAAGELASAAVEAPVQAEERVVVGAPAQAEAARATPRPSAVIAATRVFFIIVETP